MFRVKIKRIDPEVHPYGAKKTYEGFMWGNPAPGQQFRIYEKAETLRKTHPELFISKWEDIVQVLVTSVVSEVKYTGPLTGYFKTKNSLYKLEVLDENFSFNQPYSAFNLD